MEKELEGKLFANAKQMNALSNACIDFNSNDLCSLMELLPESLHHEPESHWYDPTLIIERVKSGWAVHYGIGGQGKWIQSKNLIDSVVDMLMWTKENDFMHDVEK